jgi:hypothetical protein
MKACAGVAGVLVGLAIVVLVALVILPRLKPGAGASTGAEPAGPTARTGDPLPGERINAPKSETERMQAEIERKRIPYFRMLHDRFGDYIERASVLDDIDTLDLIVKKSDMDTIQWLVQNAVGPTAREYGFERVRFYVSNPINRTEPFSIVAESAWDGSTRWNTFLK